MKTEPTETDRLAAQLFAPAGGMRAAWRGERNGVRPVWERLRDGSEATPDFYDTDDPATVGVMLAQVEDESRLARADEDARAELMACWNDCKPVGWRVANQSDRGFVGPRGPTRGAALVAAMRALKGVA